MIPMPTRLLRWMRSYDSAITARTPWEEINYVVHAAYTDSIQGIKQRHNYFYQLQNEATEMLVIAVATCLYTLSRQYLHFHDNSC